MSDDNQLSALERLTKLRESGALSEEEFAAQKATILSGTGATNIRFYRRLWVVVVLTCLLLTFPIAMLILFTGDVYKRAKDGSLTPIKNTTRYIYASVLALWLVAAVINSIVNPNSWRQDLAGGTASNGSANNASPQTAANGPAPPDMCDSSDVADMVKGAIEDSATSKIIATKVLDFGHAHELFFDKQNNARYCGADAELNSGSTKLSYKLYFGPSGGELVQVKDGEDAFGAMEMAAEAAALTQTAPIPTPKAAPSSNQTEQPSPAPDATAAPASPAQQTATTPDTDDSLVQALGKHYVGRGFEVSEPEFESSGWKELDGDIGYQIFQKGDVKIRVEYYPTGLGQITTITLLR